jgi:hypothetical protein
MYYADDYNKKLYHAEYKCYSALEETFLTKGLEPFILKNIDTVKEMVFPLAYDNDITDNKICAFVEKYYQALEEFIHNNMTMLDEDEAKEYSWSYEWMDEGEEE